MGYKGGANTKASTAKDKKKQLQHEKEMEKNKEKELKEQEQWQKGSKKTSKKELDMEKRQLELQKKQEREEILRKEQDSIKSYAARNINDAVDLFKTEHVDRHPERRYKAAYETYKSKRMVELKKENPTLRLSQLQQIIFKEFKKSPENPMNQTHAKYNATQAELDSMNEELTEMKLETLRLE